jgi:hypothetical protein
MADVAAVLFSVAVLFVVFGGPLCLTGLIVLLALPTGRRGVAFWTAAAVGLACGIWQVWFWNDGAGSNSSVGMVLFAPVAMAVAMVVTALLFMIVYRLSSRQKPSSTEHRR